MAGSGEVDHLHLMAADQPVGVGPDEGLARTRPPVPQQPGLDVLVAQRLGQQGIGPQVDHPHRHVVGGPPPGVDALELLLAREVGQGIDNGGGGHGASEGAGAWDPTLLIRVARNPGTRHEVHACPRSTLAQGLHDDASGRRERSDPAPGQQIHKNQAGIPMALCPERGNTEGIEPEAPAMDDTPPNQVPGVR